MMIKKQLSLMPICSAALFAAMVLSIGTLRVAQAEEAASKNQTTLHISDIHCGHCAQKIASKIYTLKGVKKVESNVEEKLLFVTPAAGKTLSPLALWNAVEEVKFTVTKLEGPQGTFTEKPDA